MFQQSVTFQNHVVSSNKNWRERQLNKLINNNTSQQQGNERNTVGAVPRERIDQFFRKVNQIVDKERDPGLLV